MRNKLSVSKVFFRHHIFNDIFNDICNPDNIVDLHPKRLLVDGLLLDNRVQDTLLECGLDKVKHMEQVVAVGPPLWKLVLECQLAICIDQRMPHVAQEVDGWPPVWILGRNHQFEFENCVAVVALVDKECAEPHW